MNRPGMDNLVINGSWHTGLQVSTERSYTAVYELWKYLATQRITAGIGTHVQKIEIHIGPVELWDFEIVSRLGGGSIGPGKPDHFQRSV